MNEREQKIRHLECVQNKLRYLTVGQSKIKELSDLVNAEYLNEYYSDSLSQLYLNDLKNTKDSLKRNSFKEIKNSFNDDLEREINRLKFRI